MPSRHCQKKGKLGKTSNLNQANLLAHSSLKTFTNIVCGQSSHFPGAEGGLWASLCELGAGGAVLCPGSPGTAGAGGCKCLGSNLLWAPEQFARQKKTLRSGERVWAGDDKWGRRKKEARMEDVKRSAWTLTAVALYHRWVWLLYSAVGTKHHPWQLEAGSAQPVFRREIKQVS